MNGLINETFDRFYILFSLFGFPFFILLSLMLGIDTGTGSIVYRALVLVGSILVLLKSERTLTKIRVGYISIFLILYSFRLLWDLSIRSLPTPYLPVWVIYSFYFGAIVIPVAAISSARVNILRLNKNMFYATYLQGICVLLGLFLIYGSSIMDLMVERHLFNEITAAGVHGSPLNPILVSRCGAILFILIIGNALFDNLRIVSFFSITGIFLSLLLMILGGSRGPVVAVTALLVVLLFKYLRRNVFMRLFKVLLTLSFVAYIVKMNINSIGLFKRLNDSLFRKSGMKHDREGHFESAMDQFLSHPFLGDKIFDNHLGWYPHNIVLESFMALGFLGGLILVLGLVVNLYYGFKSHLNNVYLLFASFTLFALSSGAIWTSFEFWLLIAIVSRFRKDGFDYLVSRKSLEVFN